jgi:hypothetical protein
MSGGGSSVWGAEGFSKDGSAVANAEAGSSRAQNQRVQRGLLCSSVCTHYSFLHKVIRHSNPSLSPSFSYNNQHISAAVSSRPFNELSDTRIAKRTHSLQPVNKNTKNFINMVS